MQPTSALYKRLLADSEHIRELKVVIAGMEYDQDNIFACSTYGGIVPNLAVGYGISRILNLTILPDGELPRRASISLFSRLVLGEQISEWIPSGVYNVDTRDFNDVSGLLSIEGFDAMRGAEAVWWDPSKDAGEWPMPQTEAAKDIAQCMGVELDPRNRINPALMVEYPNDLTMREVLAEIAAANMGNWSIGGDGRLLLTPLGGLPPETNFLVDDEDGGAILFGDVRIIV